MSNGTGSSGAEEVPTNPMADSTTAFLLWLAKFVNPFVRVLLKSRLHGLMSRDLLNLHFRGRKSGRWYETPVSYVQDGRRLRVFTDSPWWRNLRGAGVPTRVDLRGSRIDVSATTHSDGGAYVEQAIIDFLTRVPRDARFYAVRLEKDGQPNPADVKAAAPHSVLIELELPGSRLGSGRVERERGAERPVRNRSR